MTHLNSDVINKKYKLFFAGYDGDIEQVGIAYSDELLSGWDIHPSPIIKLGAKDADFDALQTSNPYVFKEDDTYTMIYQARSGADRQLRFGKATSKNLIDWEKDEKPFFEVAIDKSLKGKRNGCQHPHIVKIKGAHFLYFTKQVLDKTEICLAISRDNMKSWDIQEAPCLTQVNQLENIALYYPWVTQENDKWIMWYSAVAGTKKEQKWTIMRATSQDGITWERDPISPINFSDDRSYLEKLWKKMFSWERRIEGQANPCVLKSNENELLMLTHAVLAKTEIVVCAQTSDNEGINWKMIKNGIIRPKRQNWCKQFDGDPFLLIE